MKKFFIPMIFLLMIAAQASAMNLQLERTNWFITLGKEQFTLRIEGSDLADGDYSKGVAKFGNLYFHFDAPALNYVAKSRSFEDEQKIFDDASRFGSGDFENTVPVYVFEGGTHIYPISGGGHEFYLLATETGGGGSMKVIGERGGKWVKFFDTNDAKKNYGVAYDFYIEDFHAADDTIIFVYKKWQEDNFCELRYKWDEAAQWFGVEVRQNFS